MKRKGMERYARLVDRLGHAIDEQLHKWADSLQLTSEQLSWRQKYILFMIFCIGVSVVCATIILNVFK